MHARVSLSFLAKNGVGQFPKDQFTRKQWKSAINAARKASHFSEARAEMLKDIAKLAFDNEVPVVVPLLRNDSQAPWAVSKHSLAASTSMLSLACVRDTVHRSSAG